MEKIKPDRIDTLKVPMEVVEGTWGYLRDRGGRGLEGVVYWTGGATPLSAEVKHFLVPATYERESAVHLSVGHAAVFEVIGKVHELDEFLLARVHSHPEDAFHSWSDDEGCLSGRLGMLSLVVPNFARGPPSIEVLAVYERTLEGDWRRFDRAEVRRRLLFG